MSSPVATLSQRCESAISSLENLSSEDSEWQAQLDATVQSLQNFLSVTKRLTTIVEDPDAFPGLVIDATNAAENATQASSTLFKQISRLDAENVGQVSSQYWTTLSVFLGAHSRLFAHFIKISSVDDDTQRANLEGPFYAELYQQTRQVADAASQCVDVFSGADSQSSVLPIRSKQAPPDDIDDQLPPSYSERDEATPPLNTPQASSSSGNWFSSALSAVAGSFRAKPEPFVSALCQAVARGDINEARGLLKAGANINGLNEDRDTPLKVAINNGQVEAVHMLIEACADVNCTDGRDLPPLFLAAYLGRIEIASALLTAGARVDARSMSHELYFSAMCARDNNSVAGARLLLNNGADPCSRNISGQSIVATAASKGRLDMLDMLLQRGAGANSSDISAQPLIAMAVRKNDIEMVNLLLKRGANVNAKDTSGNYILAKAIQSDNMEMCRLLLDRGAMPDAKDSSNMVVLVECAIKGKVEYVRLLLERGAMANATNLNGERVLISAIGAKLQPDVKVEIVRMLLEHGAWTQAKDCSSTYTAMMLARKQGNPELIKTLASFGAKD